VRDRSAYLWQLTKYFLKLGAVGFGGPVALVGFMHRDLVEQRRWVSEDTYKLALALAQIMPGPLAAQLAIAIGYFEAGVLGATLIGAAFILPSFLMVIVISLLYVTYGGLWWMQALFYSIGTATIALISFAALWRFKVSEPVLVLGGRLDRPDSLAPGARNLNGALPPLSPNDCCSLKRRARQCPVPEVRDKI